MPIADELTKVGLKLEQRAESYVDAGFEAEIHPGEGVTVASATSDKLVAGDQILAIGGVSLKDKGPAEISAIVRPAINAAKVGSPITLVVTRNGQTIEVSVDPIQKSRPTWAVVTDPNASPAATALGKQWLVRKTPAVQ